MFRSTALLALVCSLVTTVSGVANATVFDAKFLAAPDGATLYGNAQVTNTVLELTSNLPSQQGSFIVDNLDGPHEVTAFDVTFKLFINHGTGGEGVSFVFGDFASASFGEEGPAGNALVVSFDTHDDSPASNHGAVDAGPAIDVFCNDALVSRSSVTLHNNYLANVEIAWGAQSGLAICYDGRTICTGLAVPDFTPQPGWRFGLGARTDTLYDDQWIDDLKIVTTPSVNPEPATLIVLGIGVFRLISRRGR